MALTVKEAYDQLVEKLDNKYLEIDIRTLIVKINGYEDMSSFYVHLNDPIKNELCLKSYSDQYFSGIPVAYIIKEAEFYGRKFQVNPGVFIPRMETEEVVKFAIEKAKKYFKNDLPYYVYDPCCGSGIIGTTLCHELNVENVFFSDLSKLALYVTKRNFYNHFPERNIKATFSNRSLLTALTNHFSKKYNYLIVSNPPYIINEEVDENVLEYEPHEALFCDENLTVYTKIIDKVFQMTLTKSLIVFEVSDEVEDKLKKIFKVFYPFLKYEFVKDMNKKTRILSIEVSNDENRKRIYKNFY